MKPWKKLLLLLLLLILLSQIPFAYRRYKLGRLNAAISQTNSHRETSQFMTVSLNTRVMHVHSFLGGHSAGTFKKSSLPLSRITWISLLCLNIQRKNFNTAEMTLRESTAAFYFINGNEVKTAAGRPLAAFTGGRSRPSSDQPMVHTRGFIPNVRPRLAFVAYPEEFKSWDSTGYQGIEVYNVYTNARK